jgi:hypothetical protein
MITPDGLSVGEKLSVGPLLAPICPVNVVGPVDSTAVLPRRAKSAARPRSIGLDDAPPGGVATLDVGASVAAGELAVGVVEAELLVGPPVPDTEVADSAVVTGAVEVSRGTDDPDVATDSPTVPSTEFAVLPGVSSSPPDAIAMMAMTPATAATTASGSQRRQGFGATSDVSEFSDGEVMRRTYAPVA